MTEPVVPLGQPPAKRVRKTSSYVAIPSAAFTPTAQATTVRGAVASLRRVATEGEFIIANVRGKVKLTTVPVTAAKML